MKRRLTKTIVGTIAVTLVLVGTGMLVLTAATGRRSAEEDLRSSASSIAALLDASTRDSSATPSLRLQLRRLQEGLRLSGAELLILRSDVLVSGELPAGLELDDLEPDRLRDEQVVSGREGPVVYAAATSSRVGNVMPVLVLTTDADRVVGPAFGWFLAAAAATLAFGVLVASRLSRRLVAPLAAASEAADRMARGDLAVRIPIDEDSTDELARLDRSINELARSLERSRGLERQFLMSVSHDLRTPLTSIRGYAEAIADGTATDVERAAMIVGSESRRLERLVNDLLDLARLDARRFSLHPADFDLNELISDALEGFEREAEVAGLTIELNLPAEPVPARADPDRVVQIVANLIENGLRFARSRVEVTVARVNGMAELVVADDGPGIDAADLPHVFDRLYVSQQADRRRESGSGLGLAIVRELTEAMGGRVSVTAQAPSGTRFVIDFPPAGLS